MNCPPAPTQSQVAGYDVAILGGALAGASAAILLLRERPDLKLVILEKSSCFGRRVGEATVEVSGFFLGRVLGLTRHLNDAHLVKQGMRFWFCNSQTKTLDECSEIGGRYLARVPAYQVDRAVLDEEVLSRAVALGAMLYRPCAVSRVELTPAGNQVVSYRDGECEKSMHARWVIDASGVAALLARQNRWLVPNEQHPTTAVWARWTGVKDWDGFELSRKFPKWAAACHGIRATATNHLVGPGWWAWFIPLKGGDTSIGVVFDQRLVTWPQGGSLGDRLKTFLLQHPVGRELLQDAQPRTDDVHWRKNLAYVSSVFAGDGFAVVGDAAGFIDPFYSPGMDWLSFTVYSATRLVLSERAGRASPELLDKYNRDFALSYERWFQAIYRSKYDYIGDYDLMRIAFRLDLGMYYLGIASQPFKRGEIALSEPVFSTPPALPFYHFIRTYNRRLSAIARSRRTRGVWGRSNGYRRFMFKGYTFAPSSVVGIIRATLAWLALELTEGWRSWFERESPPKSASSAARLVTLPTSR